MNPSEHVAETVKQVSASGRSALEQAEALVEVAFDLQKKPKDPQDLIDALYLYDQALQRSSEMPLARARALAGRGAALRRMPVHGIDSLVEARDALSEALTVLREIGDPDEQAEVEMTYGLVLQALASHGKAPLDHAVQAYHRALRAFTAGRYPREYAVIHNNLATAYLSMKLAPEREVMREALAVQSFQEALKVINLNDDPSEYAMLQNNLGNALQATRSTHPFENLLRAVEAYDEALKVRNRRDTPVEYANTLTNKANALMNLPDDVNQPDAGNPRNLVEAIALLEEAKSVFVEHGVHDRAQIVGELQSSLSAEVSAAAGAG